MVSTLLILAVASLALGLVCSILCGRHPKIRSMQDWEENRHEIDVQVFRVLLDFNQEQYLLNHLPHNQFHRFQRKRIGLALRMLRLVEANVGMSMRVGQLARLKGDRDLTQKADELVAAAIHLRLNLLVARFCLTLKWLYPFWNLSVPTIETRYTHLLDSLAHVRGSISGW